MILGDRVFVHINIQIFTFGGGGGGGSGVVDGGSPCRMSIIRNGNVALLILGVYTHTLQMSL